MSIPVDFSLLSQWDGALGADIHERNRIRCNYQWYCEKGYKDQVEKLEAHMRGVIARKILTRYGSNDAIRFGESK